MIRTADLEWLEKQGRQLEDYLLFFINYGISFKKMPEFRQILRI